MEFQEKELNTQPEEVLLQKIDGKELAAIMTRVKKVASGGLSSIYLVNLKINTRDIPCILKEYKSAHPKTHAQQAFNNYGLAKKAGLKVFSTFRLVQNGQSIIMTNGFTENIVCVSSNNGFSTTVEKFGRKKLPTINNFDALVDGVFNQAVLASRSEILFTQDCLLFFIKEKESQIDFVLGDMDHIGEYKEDKQSCEVNNRYSVYFALKDLIKNNIENNNVLIEKLKVRFNKEMSALYVSYGKTWVPE